jgi:hypothetical protein
MNNINNNQTNNPDEVIKCVAFLVDDSDNDSVESTLVGIDTKRKPTNISQPSRHVNVISEKV